MDRGLLARRRQRVRLALGLAAAFIAAPTTARADADWIIRDRGSHARPVRLDAMANAGFFGTLHTGISLWFSFPIVDDGLIGALNDELSIEVGGYLQYHNGYFTCSNHWFRGTPLGGLRWTFHLAREWSLFAVVKMGASFPFAAESSCNAAQSQQVTLDGAGAVGAYWQPTTWIGLRLEIGNFGIAGGAAFIF